MKTLIQIVQMLPSLISAVKAAEEFVPQPGQGKSKLDFVLGVISDTVGEIGDLIPAVTKIVARIVGLANATGVFRKA